MVFKSLFLKSGGNGSDLLDQEKLYSLYEHALQSQAQIFALKTQLHTAQDAHSKHKILAEIRQQKKMLKQARKGFNYHIKHNPDFSLIKKNAKHYVYLKFNQDINLPIKTQFANKFKQFIGRILNKDVGLTEYFKMYSNHLNYLHDESIKEILLNSFANLADQQKVIFVDQLNKQPAQIKDKVLSSQSMNDLIELRAECSRLKIDKLRYIVKEYQAQLVMNIRNMTDIKHASIEELATDYLKNHNDILANITGSFNNNLNSLMLLQKDKKLYELHVEDKDNSNNIPYYLTSLDLMEFVSAHLIEKQKLALKEILLPPNTIQHPINDLHFPSKKSQA